MSKCRQPYSADEQRASRQPDDAPGIGMGRPAVATVMLVALLSLFFAAGFWQLDRAAEKQQILDRFATAAGGELIASLVPDDTAEALRFRGFSLTGRYLPERQFLLDNMTDGGSSGYQVLTPFQTGDRLVLVNRGWVAANADRSLLPSIAVGGETRTIVGRLNDFPAPGLRLEQPANINQQWPRRLLFPTAEQLEAALGVELPGYQLQLDPGEPDGYLRRWQAVDSGPEKHLGYAFQWFSFAVLACIFYLLLMRQWFKARRIYRHQQETQT